MLIILPQPPPLRAFQSKPETIHNLQMSRKEGGYKTWRMWFAVDCVSDCLTTVSAKPDALVKAVTTGVLVNMDMDPLFS